MSTQRYYVPNDNRFTHVTLDQLKNLDKKIQEEVMSYWFDSKFSNPEDHIPYGECEGIGDIFGEIYEGREIIHEEFNGYASDEAIEQVVDKIERVSQEWIPDSEYSDSVESNFMLAGTRHEPEFSYNEVNPDNLYGLNREGLIDYMIAHFRHFHCPPEEETPYDKESGKYMYVYGGPYDARDYIYNMFDGLFSGKIINTVVRRLELDSFEWAPTDNHPDYPKHHYDEHINHVHDTDHVNDNNRNTKSFDAFDEIQVRHDSGTSFKYGSDEETKRRAEVHDKVDELLKALEKIPAHGGIGHNNPPTTIFNQCTFMGDVKQVTGKIQTETKDSHVQPNTKNVIESAGVLKKLLLWVAKKLDIGISSLMLGAGYELGKGVASQIDADIVSKLISVFDGLIRWLSDAASLILYAA